MRSRSSTRLLSLNCDCYAHACSVGRLLTKRAGDKVNMEQTSRARIMAMLAIVVVHVTSVCGCMARLTFMIKLHLLRYLNLQMGGFT